MIVDFLRNNFEKGLTWWKIFVLLKSQCYIDMGSWFRSTEQNVLQKDKIRLIFKLS